MKILIITALLLLTFGCAVSPIEGDDRDSSYAIISESTINAGGLIAAEVGTHACKVTTVGDIKGWHLVFKGDKCSGELNSEVKNE